VFSPFSSGVSHDGHTTSHVGGDEGLLEPLDRESKSAGVFLDWKDSIITVISTSRVVSTRADFSNLMLVAAGCGQFLIFVNGTLEASAYMC
jgi:hypothetical protein